MRSNTLFQKMLSLFARLIIFMNVLPTALSCEAVFSDSILLPKNFSKDYPSHHQLLMTFDVSPKALNFFNKIKDVHPQGVQVHIVDDLPTDGFCCWNGVIKIKPLSPHRFLGTLLFECCNAINKRYLTLNFAKISRDATEYAFLCEAAEHFGQSLCSEVLMNYLQNSIQIPSLKEQMEDAVKTDSKLEFLLNIIGIEIRNEETFHQLEPSISLKNWWTHVNTTHQDHLNYYKNLFPRYLNKHETFEKLTDQEKIDFAKIIEHALSPWKEEEEIPYLEKNSHVYFRSNSYLRFKRFKGNYEIKEECTIL